MSWEILSTQGLRFDYLESKVSVRNTCVNLYDAVTIGQTARLGIEQGKIDVQSKEIEIHGYLGLFEFINQVSSFFVGILTRLFSDRQGWFAAPFSIEGDYDDPSIVVQPLSLVSWFLPGFIREIVVNLSAFFFGQTGTGFDLRVTMEAFSDRLIVKIEEKGHPLIVGLDPDETIVSECLGVGGDREQAAQAIREFSLRILEGVHDLVVGVKIEGIMSNNTHLITG